MIELHRDDNANDADDEHIELPDLSDTIEAVNVPEAFAELDPEALDAAISELADGWIGGLARDEAPVDDTIDEVHDEIGHDGFIALLNTVDGTPRRLAAALSAAAYLTKHAAAIARVTRYKADEVNDTALDIGNLILNDSLEAGEKRAIEAFKNLHASTVITLRGVKGHGLTKRQAATATRNDAAAVLARLGSSPSH